MDLVMNSSIAWSETEEEETMSTRTRNLLRWFGFGLLTFIVAVVILLFLKPVLLAGVLGIVVPIGMFAILLVAFYLIIMSTKL